MRRPCAGGGRLTLERQLASVWEGLLATGAAECPVCGDRMEAIPQGARCQSCASELA
jgi:tRNA(Ile2) C34 agmatinyltransferase TiaS